MCPPPPPKKKKNAKKNRNIYIKLSSKKLIVFSLSTGCVIDERTIYCGHDIKRGYNVKNQQACATLAATIEGALFWSYRPWDKECFIKTSKKGKRGHNGYVSGNVGCAGD